LLYHAIYIEFACSVFIFAKLMETTQSAKESGHTNAENHEKEERKENGLAIFFGQKTCNPDARFRIFVPKQPDEKD
jgi:hypothetical protein